MIAPLHLHETQSCGLLLPSFTTTSLSLSFYITTPIHIFASLHVLMMWDRAHSFMALLFPGSNCGIEERWFYYDFCMHQC